MRAARLVAALRQMPHGRRTSVVVPPCVFTRPRLRYTRLLHTARLSALAKLPGAPASFSPVRLSGLSPVALETILTRVLFMRLSLDHAGFKLSVLASLKRGGGGDGRLKGRTGRVTQPLRSITPYCGVVSSMWLMRARSSSVTSLSKVTSMPSPASLSRALSLSLSTSLIGRDTHGCCSSLEAFLCPLAAASKVVSRTKP
jgi:hypothetical protein